MTPDEIKEEIAGGLISAITLDTSSFGNPSEMSLEYGLFRRLEQFRGSSVTLMLSDIVVQEVTAHLEKGANDAQAAANKALKQVGNAWQVSREKRDEAVALLFGEETTSALVDRRFAAFVERTGSLIIKSAAYVNTGELIQRYFTHAAPFSSKETKKYEFPDALALLSLEGWAKEAEKKILVVSRDDDWIRYCAESNHLVIVSELSDALSYFHADATVVCNILSLRLRNRDYQDLVTAVEGAVQDHIEGMDFIVEADSQFYFEDEITEILLNSCLLGVVDEDEVILRPVDFGEEYLVAEVTVTAEVDVSCSFTFSVIDGVDKDHLPMGSNLVTLTETLQLTALITFGGDIPNAPDIDEIEVLGNLHYVQFGTIEPDWME